MKLERHSQFFSNQLSAISRQLIACCVLLAFPVFLAYYRFMLRFKMCPDKVFMAIVTESMEMMIDQLRMVLAVHRKQKAGADAVQFLLPHAKRVFAPEIAFKLLRRMLHCHSGPGFYQLNDYHYLLLYDVLGYFCGLHNIRVNSASNERERERLSKVGAFHIQKIIFHDLIDIYFYNTDFLTDEGAAMEPSLDEIKATALHDVTFSISLGLSPHPEELKIRQIKRESPELRVLSRFWRDGSKVYPDLKGRK